MCACVEWSVVVPEIASFPEPEAVMEGERVVFRVRVTGSPQPKLTWYHDGVEVKGDYSKELAEDGSLTMPSAETKLSGVYQLVAVNPAGRVEREVKLEVREQPTETGNIGPAPPDLTPGTGMPVTLFGKFVEKCHSNQNHAFKEQYQVLLLLSSFPPWLTGMCVFFVCVAGSVQWR